MVCGTRLMIPFKLALQHQFINRKANNPNMERPPAAASCCRDWVEKQEMTPAIVLSADTAGLAVIRSLGSRGIPVIAVHYQPQDMGYVSKYVTKSVLAPHPEQREGEFLDLLTSLAINRGGGLLIPTDDAALVVVSRHKTRLEKHCDVACTDWQVTRQFIDKKYTAALARSVGVAVPETTVVDMGANLDEWCQRVGFPIIVKPCQSHQYAERFGKKCTRADNYDELLVACNEAKKADIDVMLQEYIPGNDAHNVNYNSYHVGGAPVVEFTSKKVRLSPPFFGLPRVVVSEHIPEVIEPARKFLRGLNFDGYCCTEFKLDPRDNVYKLMEVNGRHNRSASLAMRCGIDFPLIEYEYLTNGAIPSQQEFETGVYWIDEFRDAIDWVRYRGRQKYRFGEYLQPYMHQRVFATLDLTDIKPFFRRFGNALRRNRSG